MFDGCRILIVDDSRTFRAGLEAALRASFAQRRKTLRSVLRSLAVFGHEVPKPKPLASVTTFGVHWPLALPKKKGTIVASATNNGPGAPRAVKRNWPFGVVSGRVTPEGGLTEEHARARALDAAQETRAAHAGVDDDGHGAELEREARDDEDDESPRAPEHVGDHGDREHLRRANIGCEKMDEAAIARADRSLYEGKVAGRNRVILAPAPTGRRPGSTPTSSRR